MLIYAKSMVNNNEIYLLFTKRIASLVINPLTDSVRNSVADSTVSSWISSAVN